MIRVVCYEFGKPGRLIYNIAARFPVRIRNGDGTGAVLWLKGGNDVRLVSSVDMFCVELYRGVLIGYICRNESGGVCVLLPVNLGDTGLVIRGILWEVVSDLRVLV